jgi:hypothetical protein|mmetsp:Transcript_29204/g.27973  ORF Transcript_29204/g.27973 Transcript_29204/m.27973 type:complete len:81 (-) Transcript_29204:28-270(-)
MPQSWNPFVIQKKIYDGAFEIILSLSKNITRISETLEEVLRQTIAWLSCYCVGRSLISYEYFYLSGGLSDGGGKIDFLKN